MGLSLTDVYDTLEMELAPFYVNQFTYGGRVKRVYIQADAPYRMGLDAFQHLYTPSLFTSGAARARPRASRHRTARPHRTASRRPSIPSPANTSISPYNMVPLSSVVKAKWSVGPTVLPRYNGYSAIEIVGNSAAGLFDRPGDAMCCRTSSTSQLPAGFAADWTGQSYPGIAGGHLGDAAADAVDRGRVPVPRRAV